MLNTMTPEVFYRDFVNKERLSKLKKEYNEASTAFEKESVLVRFYLELRRKLHDIVNTMELLFGLPLSKTKALEVEKLIGNNFLDNRDIKDHKKFISFVQEFG